ncbi:MAG: beta-ketoacyl synthase N-terminal-like domain-containing protein, partial [Phycisphaerae bacterium]
MDPHAPIAVVGMAGLFPGASDLRAFWRNIERRHDAAREPPDGRWAIDPRRAWSPDVAPDRVYSMRACFVEEARLDAAGLDLDAALLRCLDPVARMILHVGGQAFNDANTDGLDRDRVGVILAA